MDEDNNDKKNFQLGEKLESVSCGFCLKSDTGKNVLVYYRCPESLELCYLFSDVIVLEDPTLLRQLCQNINIARGYRTQWTCQRKGIGRLYAQCAHGGILKKSKTRGIRNRSSKKVGCTALIRTVPLMRNASLGSLQHKIEDKVASIINTADDERKTNGGKLSFCVIRNIQLDHTEHVLEETEGESTVLNSARDVLSNHAVIDQLKGFLQIFPSGKGCLIKAKMLLQSTMPSIHISPNVLKTVITQLRHVEEDAQMLLDELRDGLEVNGNVEYFKHTKEDGTGVLNFVAWTYKGARELVKRCGDLLFWDSTHHVTKYDYKLSSFTLVDSEGKSRCVMLGLMLHERAQDFQQFLNCWHDAFGVSLPEVIFTDGDDGMSAAISSLPYSQHINHMLCSFHLFDLNTKKKIQPLLINGSCSWPQFRKKLSACREASDQNAFETFWNDTLKGSFRSHKQTAAACTYLNKYIYAKRKQWAISFNKNTFTIGASTTQRSESWNSIVKSISKIVELKQMVGTLYMLFKRQMWSETTSKSASARKQHIQNLDELLGEDLLEKLVRSRLSRYASVELRKEIQAAFTLKVKSNSNLILKGSACRINLTGEVHDKPFYCNENEEHRKRTVSVSVTVTENGEVETMQCTCLYPSRMKIPCRHIIQLAISLDNMDGNGFSNMQPEENISTWFEFIILKTWSLRWRNPFSLLKSTNEYQIAKDETSEDEISYGEVKGKDLNCTPRKKKVMGNEPDEYTYESVFPKTIRDGGGRIAFSKLSSQFKALCETLTRSDQHLMIGKLFYEVSDEIIETVSRWERTADRNSRHKLGKLSKDVGTLLSKKFVQRTDSNSLVGSSTCESTENISKASSTEAPTTAIDLDINEKVSDPPKRMDHRTKNSSNVQQFKSRSERAARRNSSRRAPTKSGIFKRMDKPEQSKRIEFACPHCSTLTPQNNPENVRQHINSKHINKGYTSVQKMRDACQAFYKSISSSSNSESSSFSLKYEEPDDGNKMDSKKLEPDAITREAIENIPIVSDIWKTKVTRNAWNNISDTVTSGECVELFWKMDLSWYRGKIENCSSNSGKKMVKILYDDGDEETTNLDSEKWRVVKRGTVEPKFDVLERGTILRGMEILKLAVSEESSWMPFRVGKVRSVRVSPSDIISLKRNSWLTDGIVELFVSGIVQNSTNVNDTRFAQIDSQAIVLASNNTTMDHLLRTMKGIALHEVDQLVWPICYHSHWYLSVAYIGSREFTVIDPKRPKAPLKAGTFLNLVRSVFAQLTKHYDDTYGVSKKWEVISPEVLSSTLQLPTQPADNGSDCGVLICLYAWAVLTGQNIVGIDGTSFDECMENARYTIAGMVHSWRE